MQIILTSNIKWNLAINKLECKYTQTPNVYFIVVAFVLYNLRRNINWSSTKWFSWLLSLSGPSKITDFCNISMKDNILSLNISVNDIHFMEIVDSITYLPDDRPNIVLWKWSFFFKFLIKISRATKFHKEINCFLSRKCWIKFNDIWMVKFQMNFRFPDETLSINFSGQFLFEYFFQGKDRMCFDMSDNVNCTKWSLSTEVKNFKIADF